MLFRDAFEALNMVGRTIFGTEATNIVTTRAATASFRTVGSFYFIKFFRLFVFFALCLGFIGFVSIPKIEGDVQAKLEKLEASGKEFQEIKSPVLAAVLRIVPGVGQMYAGEPSFFLSPSTLPVGSKGSIHRRGGDNPSFKPERPAGIPCG